MNTNLSQQNSIQTSSTEYCFSLLADHTKCKDLNNIITIKTISDDNNVSDNNAYTDLHNIDNHPIINLEYNNSPHHLTPEKPYNETIRASTKVELLDHTLQEQQSHYNNSHIQYQVFSPIVDCSQHNKNIQMNNSETNHNSKKEVEPNLNQIEHEIRQNSIKESELKSNHSDYKIKNNKNSENHYNSIKSYNTTRKEFGLNTIIYEYDINHKNDDPSLKINSEIQHNSSDKKEINNKNIEQNIEQNANKESTEKPIKYNLMPYFNINDDYDTCNEQQKKIKRIDKFTQLMNLKMNGCELSKTYNINSDYWDMCAEVKFHTDIKNKEQGVELWKDLLINACQVIEFVNTRYDPFGLNLSGWTDQVKHSRNNYTDVFSELYEKYKSTNSNVEPEVKLLLLICISAGTFHTSKTVSKISGLESLLQNNPEILSKLESMVAQKLTAQPEQPQTQTQTVNNAEYNIYQQLIAKKAKETENSSISNINPADMRIEVTETINNSDSTSLSSIITGTHINKKRIGLSLK